MKIKAISNAFTQIYPDSTVTHWLFHAANIDKANYLLDLGVTFKEARDHGRPKTSSMGENPTHCRAVVNLMYTVDKKAMERQATLSGYDNVTQFFLAATGRPDPKKRGNAVDTARAKQVSENRLHDLQAMNNQVIAATKYKAGSISHHYDIAKELQEKADSQSNQYSTEILLIDWELNQDQILLEAYQENLEADHAMALWFAESRLLHPAPAAAPVTTSVPAVKTA